MEQNSINSKYIPITYIVIGVLSLVFIFFNINHSTFWFDEGFSLLLIQDTYSQIWNITADDVHPPLYYWMLKAFTTIFGDTIVTARLFSALPILLSIALGYTHVRKIWNDRTAMFFMLLILLHPAMHYPMSEIRMYSWALFFCLATYIYAYQFYTELRYKDLILLVFFALCAAYTHYYALITVAAIFGGLFIAFCINKRNKLYLFFIASLCCIIGYAPWLSCLLSQVNTITEDYWIDKIVDFSEVVTLLSPFVKLKIVGLILLPLLIGSIVYSNKNTKKNSRQINDGLILLLISITPMIVGIVYSALIRPVFIARYIYPSLPLFLLGISLLLSTLNFKNKIILTIVCLFFGFITFETIRTTKKETKGFREIEDKEKRFDAFISETIDSSYIFLHHYASHAQMPYWVLKYPNQRHIAREEPIIPRNQVVEYTPHKKINSLEKLPENYKHIFYDCYIKNGFAGNSKDSIDLMSNYTIVREVHSPEYNLYELKRINKQHEQ